MFYGKAVCKTGKMRVCQGHFDRVNEAIMDILTNEDEIKREVIEEYAKAHRVCPFELALDLTIWADAVICDYNYVFDPRVYLKRFFSDAAVTIFFWWMRRTTLWTGQEKCFRRSFRKELS